MKTKKEMPSNDVIDENLEQWHKRFLLGKRKAAKENEKAARKKEEYAVFEKKRKIAPDKKSPVTLRTKGYYRFSKDFPSNVDDKGFRENNPLNKKRRNKIILFSVLCCLVVFCSAYIISKACLFISEHEALTEAPPPTEQSDNCTFKAYHFSYNELNDGDTNYITKTLEENNCNTAVFEFKDKYGYVMFNTGSFIGASADRRIANAKSTLDAVKAAGYDVAAYISCFTDTVAAQADITYSVRANTADGMAWLDNSYNGWLNPYSQEAKDYLLGLISSAATNGFTYILLDNVAFSDESGNATAFFPGEAESGQSRNTVLKTFVNSAVQRAGTSKIILMCGIDGFDIKSNDSTAPYYGALLGTDAGAMCADTRLSLQKKNTAVGEQIFSNPIDLPYVFVLAAGEFINDSAKAYYDNSDKAYNVFLCIERSQTSDEQRYAVIHSGVNGIIIW